MRVLTLPPETTAQTGANLKVIVGYADVAALGASAAAALALFDVAIGDRVQLIGTKLTTDFDFSDTGITSLGLEVGDGVDPNGYLVAQELAVDGTEIDYKTSEGAAWEAGHAYNAADTVDATFTAANGGSPLLSETTSGEVEIYFRVYSLNELAKPR